MNKAEYISAAKQFAKDTSEWGGLDNYKMYVAIDGGKWVETCDNGEGGIAIDWAFKLPADLIEGAGSHYFFTIAMDEARRGLEEEWDAEQWAAFARRFT